MVLIACLESLDTDAFPFEFIILELLPHGLEPC